MKYKINGGGFVATLAATDAWALDIDMAANCVGEITALRFATQSADGSNGPALVQIWRCDSHAGSGGTAITPVPENPYHTAAARVTSVKRGETTGAMTNGELIEEHLVPVQGEVEFVLLPQVSRWVSKAGGNLIVVVQTPQVQNLRVGADLAD